MKTSTAPVWTARSVDEALALRAEHPEAMPIAGGTDVMVVLETGAIDPPGFLNLWGCGLRSIADDGRTIGAGATWTDLVKHPAVHPAIRECALTVGALQIQNRGTVGGNVVNASPAGDSLPLWLVLDAEFEVGSVRGRRRIPAEKFWTGYRRTALEKDELLLAVHLPDLAGHRVHYRKVGTRLAQAISKVVLAGRLRVRDGIVEEARVALGSVAPIPVRARAVENALLGRPIDPGAAKDVLGDIAPIDDVRSTASYRRTVASRIVRSWLAAEAAA